MKRIQLFEFEDFSWLPHGIRASMTRLIVVFHKMTGTKEVVMNRIDYAREKIDFDRIVDMGSGSGGIMPDAVKGLNEEGGKDKLQLLLTDLHPDPATVARFNEEGDKEVSYQGRSLDATNFSEVPAGLKTMINSFHHMPPPVARKILHSAQDNRQPFLIYEMAENKIPTLLWWLLLPLSLLVLIVMAMVMTIFSRPLTAKQLLFTYPIPLIPLAYAWDGQASLVRMYTFSDLRELIGEEVPEGYRWEMDVAKKENGKTLGYYVLGYPV